MRVLVTGSGGPAGRALIAMLAERGLDVLGADMAPVMGLPVPTRRLPAAADPLFLTELGALVESESIDLLVPTVSEELPVLASAVARELWPHACGVVIGEADAVRAADDKLVTAQRLRAADVSVPRFARPSQLSSVVEATSWWGAPIVLKPRVSRGGRGVHLLSSDRDLDWRMIGDDQIVQEFAPGIEYAPVVYRPRAGASGDVTVVLEKSAAGDRIRRVEAPDVAALALRAAGALGLTGPVDVDVRRDPAGRPVVLEVNARVGANVGLAPELVDAMLADHARLAQETGPAWVT
ncbi:ATP-grasp domain-containing protein [Ruania alkalisoli]|nr:ATP-grasp domain-containing protein [Ruania alkalisoli]